MSTTTSLHLWTCVHETSNTWGVFWMGRRLGSLVLHASGFDEWTLPADGPMPSRLTSCKLAKAARAIAERAEEPS